ncbi:corticotropin-releasing factor receptor type-like protein [Sarcoptes scabiei]|uniref:Corticotropin-releasing factor receptor type-like protein n=1 Tax=Sarcoptes scabiei TaxID=52283 RepID=A0A132A423_SARSC|nr:corticotropin-releasing factor receptor type-like protein [Sarcoptes scabiei]
MWVLITKLRATNSIESKQYQKAHKALWVLIPLLGIGYIMVLVTPTHPTAKLIFQYLQAILVSTQGFTVAVLYCFCNGEVRTSLRHHFQRIQIQRTLRYGEGYASQSSGHYRSSMSTFSHHSFAHRASNRGSSKSNVKNPTNSIKTNNTNNKNNNNNNNNNNDNINGNNHSNILMENSTKKHHQKNDETNGTNIRMDSILKIAECDDELTKRSLIVDETNRIDELRQIQVPVESNPDRIESIKNYRYHSIPTSAEDEDEEMADNETL